MSSKTDERSLTLATLISGRADFPVPPVAEPLQRNDHDNLSPINADRIKDSESWYFKLFFFPRTLQFRRGLYRNTGTPIRGSVYQWRALFPAGPEARGGPKLSGIRSEIFPSSPLIIRTFSGERSDTSSVEFYLHWRDIDRPICIVPTRNANYATGS